MEEPQAATFALIRGAALFRARRGGGGRRVALMAILLIRSFLRQNGNRILAHLMTGIAAPWDIMGIKQGDSILYSHLSLTHGMIADIDIGYEDFRCVPRATPRGCCLCVGRARSLPGC